MRPAPIPHGQEPQSSPTGPDSFVNWKGASRKTLIIGGLQLPERPHYILGPKKPNVRSPKPYAPHTDPTRTPDSASRSGCWYPGANAFNRGPPAARRSRAFLREGRRHASCAAWFPSEKNGPRGRATPVDAGFRTRPPTAPGVWARPPYVRIPAPRICRVWADSAPGPAEGATSAEGSRAVPPPESSFRPNTCRSLSAGIRMIQGPRSCACSDMGLPAAHQPLPEAQPSRPPCTIAAAQHPVPWGRRRLVGLNAGTLRRGSTVGGGRPVPS